MNLSLSQLLMVSGRTHACPNLSGVFQSSSPIDLGTKIEYLDIRLLGVLINSKEDSLYGFVCDHHKVGNPVFNQTVEKEYGLLLASIHLPAIGNLYRHHKGADYVVVDIANVDSTNPDYPVTVIYKGINGKTWAKPLHNFVQKMTFIRSLAPEEVRQFCGKGLT